MVHLVIMITPKIKMNHLINLLNKSNNSSRSNSHNINKEKNVNLNNINKGDNTNSKDQMKMVKKKTHKIISSSRNNTKEEIDKNKIMDKITKMKERMDKHNQMKNNTENKEIIIKEDIRIQMEDIRNKVEGKKDHNNNNNSSSRDNNMMVMSKKIKTEIESIEQKVRIENKEIIEILGIIKNILENTEKMMEGKMVIIQ